jgi:hypothetical protein
VTELVMALRCIDGMVVAGDAPLGEVPPERRAIRPLSDHLVMLLHGPMAPGNRMLDEWLESSPSFDVPMAQVADEWHASVSLAFEKWAKKEPGIQTLGMILTGIDVHGTGDMDCYGLHASGRFEPRRYTGNVFGGEYTSIARLIAAKVHTFSVSVASGLRRAAFYFVESRTVLKLKIEPALALGTITPDRGYEALNRQQVAEHVQEASLWSERLFAACARLVTPQWDEDGGEG